MVQYFRKFLSGQVFYIQSKAISTQKFELNHLNFFTSPTTVGVHWQQLKEAIFAPSRHNATTSSVLEVQRDVDERYCVTRKLPSSITLAMSLGHHWR